MQSELYGRPESEHQFEPDSSFSYVPIGFFRRGISAMMIFLGLSFGGSGLVLTGSLVIISSPGH